MVAATSCSHSSVQRSGGASTAAPQSGRAPGSDWAREIMAGERQRRGGAESTARAARARREGGGRAWRAASPPRCRRCRGAGRALPLVEARRRRERRAGDGRVERALLRVGAVVAVARARPRRPPPLHRLHLLLVAPRRRLGAGARTLRREVARRGFRRRLRLDVVRVAGARGRRVRRLWHALPPPPPRPPPPPSRPPPGGRPLLLRPSGGGGRLAGGARARRAPGARARRLLRRRRARRRRAHLALEVPDPRRSCAHAG